ncbi:5-hydroxytryptamine receptor 1A-alpha-like [Strongylocentrotus purpuratus]|uniref:G-protein coupled receptors family 1 profile domain-containing protein n=1 Tax=Strongylocentrotus purpuratus TaxID=7668 RepID=A0A7M7RFD7_STRPU|nr:5-hydroxytryptamine receptor 1A-alpha-like [Strongylocentrotus purpuratus]|eukprot:XP_798518.1 PREDICTED: 5-hydroxytryptamine receptor 1A-alpha-like [Strongylocentrotus purpuratus]
MADISNSTQTYSTDMFWTDIQNTSEYMNVPTQSLDPFGTTQPNLRSLIFLAVFFALIVLANIISLGAFLVEKRLRTYNNYFIINLTILDLLVGIGLVIYVEHWYINRYPFSQNACKVLTGIFSGIVNASNINVVVICADRHQAVYDPINHFISRSKRKAIIINSLPWVIGLSFWIGYVTVWEFIVDHDNGLHCTQRFLLSPLTNMIQNNALFLMPLAIIAVLYVRIYIKIRKTVGRRNNKKSTDLTDLNLSTAKDNEMTSVNVSSTSHTGSFSDITETGSRDDTMISSSSSRNETKNGNIGQEISTSTSHRVESTAEMTKATRTLLFIVIAFVLTWIPISVITLIYTIEPRLIVPSLSLEAFTFIVNLQYGNSLLNPISYAMSQPLFRATIIKMFSCKQPSQAN